ncbi:MAG: alpha/beta fold hydrolase [Microthrixaceae bacterium]
MDGLRVHYLDEGEASRGVALMLHGEPTWSYLYRNLIPYFVEAGWRVVAPDLIGFGRSDKVVDEQWYTFDAHMGVLGAFISRLDLSDITLLCQDWGGPLGLVTAAEDRERFERLVVMNTWLHHDDYEYPQFIKDFREATQQPGFDFGSVAPAEAQPFSQTPPAELQRAYSAPFHVPEADAGARRFPFMLPYAEPEIGGARRQADAFEELGNWDGPAHVVFGTEDPSFSVEWGRRFAEHLGADFDPLEGVGHFVQEAGRPVAELMLRRIEEEP